MRLSAYCVLAAALLTPGLAMAADGTIPVGHLADNSGPTADVGLPYGQGITDALAYINQQGGVAGQKLDVDSVDYSYQVPRAVATYKKWTTQNHVVAIQGWGTADTEALSGFLVKDKVPYFSASYAGALTDPLGKGTHASRPAPFNFFYGPSYSDANRALIQWARDDWKKRGMTTAPKYVHMGANHPYPNAPKAAAQAYARQLGFEVLTDIQYSLAPGDFTAQCLTLKDSGANYAYMGNTGGSNISLLKACGNAGVKVQFLGNIWGMDENAMKAAGKAADGVVFPVRTAVTWLGNDAPGMTLMRAISKTSDPGGTAYRSVHYMAAVCTTYFMKEAMDWATAHGGVSGDNIRQGMEQKANWVPKGLEGVCKPSTWTKDDHRGMTNVTLYQAHVTGATDAPVFELLANKTMSMTEVAEIDIPRQADWLGW